MTKFRLHETDWEVRFTLPLGDTGYLFGIFFKTLTKNERVFFSKKFPNV